MKKKLCIILLISSCILFTVCDNIKVNVEVDNNETVTREIGTSSLISIGENIYYDESTYIVYFWNGNSCYDASTMPSPYYAPNGYPYVYDPQTNTLKEIGE